MPVRKIPIKSKSLSGLFSSIKNGRQVAFESALERDFIVLQEFSPEVARYEEQPLHIPIQKPDGRVGKYTPDFLVWYHDPGRKTALVEIKYESQLREQASELAPAFEAANRHAAENGLEFQVVTDLPIRIPLLKNAKFLLPFRNHPPPSLLVGQVMQAVATGRSLIVAELVKTVAVKTNAEPAEVIPCIWFLVATFRLHVELTQPITMKSMASIPSKELANALGASHD